MLYVLGQVTSPRAIVLQYAQIFDTDVGGLVSERNTFIFQNIYVVQ